jgi:glycerol-3-phosphate dehydrogenase
MPQGETYDLVVAGGGINGAGIARDAAGRGLRVLLAEADDLARGTSSASSKLIHGGLRYLEQYEFRLVREALSEREVLLRMAPHIIWPMRFVLPHHKALRPAWILRLGLFLYDHLGGRQMLPPTATRRAGRDAVMAPLRDPYRLGFEYSDCWVEDSRLVVLNARDAADRGAEILTRTALATARREDGRWHITLRQPDGTPREIWATALVNAAGPWVQDVAQRMGRQHNTSSVRLVKGSHIVVPALWQGPQAFILQNADGRIVFAIPYQDRFTLIGTTDIPFAGDPARVAIDAAETEYLCDIAGRYFRTPLAPEDVVWSYSGVRPLYDDGSANASAITRDYVLDLDRGTDGAGAPLLSIYGGKITTYRVLAEHALEKLGAPMGWHAPAWTADSKLPGGDLPDGDFAAFLRQCAVQWPFVPPAMLRRLARAYGTRIDSILGTAHDMAALGRRFGDHLTEAEVAYLRQQEWAVTEADILWRRSKLGLYLSAGQAAELAEYLSA